MIKKIKKFDTKVEKKIEKIEILCTFLGVVES